MDDHMNPYLTPAVDDFLTIAAEEYIIDFSLELQRAKAAKLQRTHTQISQNKNTNQQITPFFQTPYSDVSRNLDDYQFFRQSLNRQNYRHNDSQISVSPPSNKETLPRKRGRPFKASHEVVNEVAPTLSFQVDDGRKKSKQQSNYRQSTNYAPLFAANSGYQHLPVWKHSVTGVKPDMQVLPYPRPVGVLPASTSRTELARLPSSELSAQPAIESETTQIVEDLTSHQVPADVNVDVLSDVHSHHDHVVADMTTTVGSIDEGTGDVSERQ